MVTPRKAKEGIDQLSKRPQESTKKRRKESLENNAKKLKEAIVKTAEAEGYTKSDVTKLKTRRSRRLSLKESEEKNGGPPVQTSPRPGTSKTTRMKRTSNASKQKDNGRSCAKSTSVQENANEDVPDRRIVTNGAELSENQDKRSSPEQSNVMEDVVKPSDENHNRNDEESAMKIHPPAVSNGTESNDMNKSTRNISSLDSLDEIQPVHKVINRPLQTLSRKQVMSSTVVHEKNGRSIRIEPQMSINKDVSELGRNSVTATDSTSGKESSSTASKTKKTWTEESYRKKYLDVMEGHCYGYKTFMCRKTVAGALASSFVATIIGIGDRPVLQSADLKMVCDLLFFGRYSSMKKETCFRSEFGSIVSIFRQKVVKNLIFHLRKGYINNHQAGFDIKSKLTDDKMRWLDEVIVNDRTLDKVSKVQEKTGGGQNQRALYRRIGQKNNEVTCVEVTDFIMNFIYTMLINALNRNRKNVKKVFYGRLAYLYDDWTESQFCEVEKKLKVIWVSTKRSESEYVALSEIPDCATVGTKNKDLLSIDDYNEGLFKNLTVGRKELLFVMEHEVMIKKTKKSKNVSDKIAQDSDPENNVRPFQRPVCLLDIALAVLSEICGIDTSENQCSVLKYHKRSLSACYVIAISVKQMLLQKKGFEINYEDNVSAEDIIERGGETNVFKTEFDNTIDNELFNQLLPSVAERKQILEKEIGAVSYAFWRKNHIGGAGPQNHGEADDQNVSDSESAMCSDDMEGNEVEGDI